MSRSKELKNKCARGKRRVIRLLKQIVKNWKPAEPARK